MNDGDVLMSQEKSLPLPDRPETDKHKTGRDMPGPSVAM